MFQTLNANLLTTLQALKDKGLYRQRLISESFARGRHFSSNDYLGITENKAIQAAYLEGFTLHSCGSGASMIVSGYYEIHQRLEQTFCNFLNAEAGLLFSSGYMANLGVLSLLKALNLAIIIDKNAHASLYDGIKQAELRCTRFLHNDLNHLSQQLSKTQQPGVIVEGLYSMSGQIPDFDRLAELSLEHEAPLIVDEAHAFGVIGEQGRGAAAKLSSNLLPLRIIPFGKTLGAQGAIVVGKALWIEALIQVARPFIYSTAMSPALAYGVLKSLEWVMQAEDERAQLQKIIAYFNHKKNSSALKWRVSTTAIQQLQLQCPHKALYFGQALRERGILCLPMRAPTVPLKETGLRVILTIRHTTEDLDYLFEQLDQLHEQTL